MATVVRQPAVVANKFARVPNSGLAFESSGSPYAFRKNGLDDADQGDGGVICADQATA